MYKQSLHRGNALGVAGVMALALALAGCGGSSDDGAATDDSSGGTYAWGLNAELSGPVSFYGKGIEQGIKAYVEQVNAEGGINGKKIVLTALDNAGEAARTTGNATQLVTNNKVIAMFGTTLSANCSAAQVVAERSKVPTSCGAVQKPNPWIYNSNYNAGKAAPALFAAAKKITGKDNPRVAMLNANTLTVLALAKAVKADAASAGLSIATMQEFDIAATDVSQQVAQVVASKPEAVFMSSTPAQFIAAVKGLRAAKQDMPIIWVDGTTGLATLSKSTDANTYALSVYKQVDPASTDAFAKKFIDAIKGVSGKTPEYADLNSSIIAPSYMTASAFGAALKECGASCDGAKLQESLNKTDLSMDGMVDSFKYTADEHYPYTNWYLYKAQGGDNKLVETIPAS